MADTVDKETRSRIMAAIGGKNTKPKMVLHKAMHARGFCLSATWIRYYFLLNREV